MVKIQDAQGNLVTDAIIRVFNQSTGDELDVSAYHNADAGMYCILNDEYLEDLTEEGVIFVMAIQRPGGEMITENFVFDVDSCRCHIHMAYGKTTVVYPWFKPELFRLNLVSYCW